MFVSKEATVSEAKQAALIKNEAITTLWVQLDCPHKQSWRMLRLLYTTTLNYIPLLPLISLYLDIMAKTVRCGLCNVQYERPYAPMSSPPLSVCSQESTC
jgi:hypothetical protein